MGTEAVGDPLRHGPSTLPLHPGHSHVQPSVNVTSVPPVQLGLQPLHVLAPPCLRRPCPSRLKPPQTPTHPRSNTSPVARVLAALRRTQEQGRLLIEGDVGGPRKELLSIRPENGNDVPKFVLEKDYHTVESLWKEYDQGVLGRLLV